MAGETLNKALDISEKINVMRLDWDVHENFVLLYKVVANQKLAKIHQDKLSKVIGKIRNNIQNPQLLAALPKI